LPRTGAIVEVLLETSDSDSIFRPARKVAGLSTQACETPRINGALVVPQKPH
jgi:hypothetical protein